MHEATRRGAGKAPGNQSGLRAASTKNSRAQPDPHHILIPSWCSAIEHGIWFGGAVVHGCAGFDALVGGQHWGNVKV